MKKVNSKTNAKTLVTAGLLIALSVVLTRFMSIIIPLAGSNSLRLGLGTIPVVISGFILGPFVGVAVGALSDIVGFAINPMGPYFPGFTLSQALYGFIPGYLTYYVFKKYSTQALITSIIACEVIISMILNTKWLSILFGTPFLVLLPWRMVGAVAMIFVHVIIDRAILKAFRFNYDAPEIDEAYE